MGQHVRAFILNLFGFQHKKCAHAEPLAEHMNKTGPEDQVFVCARGMKPCHTERLPKYVPLAISILECGWGDRYSMCTNFFKPFHNTGQF